MPFCSDATASNTGPAPRPNCTPKPRTKPRERSVSYHSLLHRQVGGARLESVGSFTNPYICAYGWNIRFLPTRPDELASPFGNLPLTELSSSRGVPTPLQATITTSAAWNCSLPS